MLSFENTETAFANRSDADLKRAELLFRLVGNDALVRTGKSALHVAMALRLPITGIIKKTVFNHFCGGETVADCEGTIQNLYDGCVHTLLDYSAEGKDNEDDFDRTVGEVINTIIRAKTDKRIPFAVFKCSGVVSAKLLENKTIGVALKPAGQRAWDRGLARIRTIVQTAADNDVPVMVDAEETWLQGAVDRLVMALMEEFNIGRAVVLNTYQMYCHDRLDYLKSTHRIAQEKGFILGVKLVRGAYMEQERERAKRKGRPSPIHATKADTDAAYDAALAYCIQHLDTVHLVSGTHNERSSLYLTELMESNGLQRDDKRVFAAQLYGMSDNISFNLASEGYNVVKYVPYGPVRLVMPYLIRRAEENTSVSGQMGRELSLIVKEQQRRRGQR